MAQEIKSFADHVGGFWRHVKLALATVAGIVLIGSFIALSLPDRYRSSAVILIEQPEIPEALVRTTVTVFAAQQIASLNERIMATPNLVDIIEKFGLYPEERKDRPARLLANRVKGRIKVNFITSELSAGGRQGPGAAAFSISFEDEDPERAQAVANELVSMYMAENLKARTEQTAETKAFIDVEVNRLDKRVGELELELSEFKRDNADSLPSLNMVSLNMMDRIDSKLLELDRQLYTIEENRVRIKAQLSTIDPTTPVRLPDGTMVMSPSDQLKALQTQLTIYQGRYSEDHPDVIKVRSDIAALEKRFGLDVEPAKLDDKIVAARAALAVAKESYSDDHPDVLRLQGELDELEVTRNRYDDVDLDDYANPDNPAYISLQTQLASLAIDEQALSQERQLLEADLIDYEKRLMRMPLVERELSALSRELNSVSNRYWVLRDKQFGAEMGQTLELQSKGERFTLIEPPAVPLRPFAPDRPSIFVLSLLVGLVLGVAITQLADALDDSIYSSAAVEMIQGSPPIVEIPVIASLDKQGLALNPKYLVIGAIPVTIALLLLIVHLFIKPLDVLFFAGLRALGL